MYQCETCFGIEIELQTINSSHLLQLLHLKLVLCCFRCLLRSVQNSISSFAKVCSVQKLELVSTLVKTCYNKAVYFIMMNNTNMYFSL